MEPTEQESLEKHISKSRRKILTVEDAKRYAEEGKRLRQKIADTLIDTHPELQNYV